MNDEEKREQRFKRITTAPIYPLLWKMAIPSMIGMVVGTVYSMTDTYFVGKLNNTDLTASVGVVYSFISIIQAIGFWFGYGSGNYISRKLGKKDIESARTMAATGIVIALIAGAVITVSGLLFIQPLAVLLGGGTSEALMNATVEYLRITVLTVPFMLIANVIYNQLRLAGSARNSMIGFLAGMLINMILDPVFILVLRLGISGAAFASMAGQIAGMIILIIQTTRDGNVNIVLKKAQLDKEHIKEILAGGAPNFCRQGITSITTALMNNVAGGFGPYAIATITITGRIIYIAYALVIGFGQGFQPICALNYGAGLYKRVKTAFNYAQLTATGFLCVSSFILMINAEFLITSFTDEPDVIALGVKILLAQCIVLPLIGYYILIGMMLQNIGRFLEATLVTISENGIFLIITVLIMPAFMGINGLIWCKPAASILALLTGILIGWRAWHIYLKEEKKENVHQNV